MSRSGSNMMSSQILFLCVFLGTISICLCRLDIWNYVPCNEDYQPPDCDFSELDMLTVDDYDRCGPAKLNLHDRNYFLGA
ncbi:hydroxyacid oxidase 1, partial [Nephila pilipes]